MILKIKNNVVNQSKYMSTIRRYLDKVFGGLECVVSYGDVIWYKDGRPVASVEKNSDRLRISSREFNTFIGLFSLPWITDDDGKMLADMISPHLKFDGGTPAIEVLVNLRFIKKITHVALPVHWK
jgi:hypothetical protein